MPTLLPFRDYDEHDVLNYYKFSGTIPASKGLFVKGLGSGITTANAGVHEMLGAPGIDIPNVESQRWGITPAVGAVTASGDTVLGMLLYDVKEVDENGEKLIYNPRKAAEMEVAVSGLAVPIVTRGVFLYSGVQGVPTAGAPAYVDSNGALLAAAGTVTATRVGTFLGLKDTTGKVFFKLDV